MDIVQHLNLSLRLFLRRTMLLASALVLSLSTFFALAPTAFAAAPQDTYSWVRNIGTPGCPPVASFPETLSSFSVAVGGSRVYVSSNNQIYIFDTTGSSVGKFGSAGTGDGQFDFPNYITVDLLGNVYIQDTYNQRIQKFDADGNFLMKFGSSGTGNGQFHFGNNGGIAVDVAGNIYVLDAINNRIEKFDSTGTYLSQFPLSAGSQPANIVMDSAGNLLVLFQYALSGSLLYKYSTSGAVISSYPIINGTADGQVRGGLYGVLSLSLDSAGDIYIGDSGNNRIQKFNPSGSFLMKFNGLGNQQLYLASDASDNVWVTDAGFASPVRKFDSNGNFLLQITQYTPPAPPDPGGPSSLCLPVTIARDASGNLYVVDQTRNNVKIYNPDGTVKTVFGSQGSGNGQFSNPSGIALSSSGDIYVLDAGNLRIQKFNNGGTYISQFGSSGSGNGQFGGFYFSGALLAVDGSGNIYVGDQSNGRVQKFDNNGNYLSQFPITATGASTTYPLALAVDTASDIYVATIGVTPASTLVNEVIKYDTNGTPLSRFGSSGTGDGQFGTFMDGIAVDSIGGIYVADSSNNRIQKFDASGTYLSQFGTAGTGNTQFSNPAGLTTDSDGNIYIADSSNQRVSVWSAPIAPSSPQNLTQKPLSSTSARIAWSAPANTGTLAYTYTVQYRIKSTNTWTSAAANLPSSQTSYDLTGLTAGTAYDIQVLAVNSVGVSPVASLSFVMGAANLADTGMDAWLYVGIAAMMLTSAGVVFWRNTIRHSRRFI